MLPQIMHPAHLEPEAPTADDPAILAYSLGAQDAREGLTACPEMYFYNHSNLNAYCEGYESFAGPTLTTHGILRPDEPNPFWETPFPSFSDIGSESEGTEDYEEDILDRLFWSRGEW